VREATPQPERAEPYTALATVYDTIMAEVEYDAWADFILAVARSRGYAGGPLLDLGCGTGNASVPMVDHGLHVTGLDASPAMLAVARAKLPGVTLHLADFASFAIPGRFALVFSVFDALNNLLDDETFLATCRCVLEHLQPGGLFVFDVNTPTGLRELWEGGAAEGWADEVYYRWQHSFDAETGLARVEAYCDGPDGSFTEVHTERGYDAAVAIRLLGAAGFEAVEALSFPEAAAPPPEAERIWVVGRKPRLSRPARPTRAPRGRY